MAKDKANKEPLVTVVDKTDFVKLMNEAQVSMGSSSFLKATLITNVTNEGLVELNKVYNKAGYEVFANGKDVLLLKQ